MDTNIFAFVNYDVRIYIYICIYIDIKIDSRIQTTILVVGSFAVRLVGGAGTQQLLGHRAYKKRLWMQITLFVCWCSFLALYLDAKLREYSVERKGIWYLKKSEVAARWCPCGLVYVDFSTFSLVLRRSCTARFSVRACHRCVLCAIIVLKNRQTEINTCTI